MASKGGGGRGGKGTGGGKASKTGTRVKSRGGRKRGK